MKCEYCEKETNGNYLNGRFCDKHCARNSKRFPKDDPVEEAPKIETEQETPVQPLEISTKKKKTKQEK